MRQRRWRGIRSQYGTRRGKGAVIRECEELGRRQIVAKPPDPRQDRAVLRAVGRECVEIAVFTDLGGTRELIGLFIDCTHRSHLGIDGTTPPDTIWELMSTPAYRRDEPVAKSAVEPQRLGVVDG